MKFRKLLARSAAAAALAGSFGIAASVSPAAADSPVVLTASEYNVPTGTTVYFTAQTLVAETMEIWMKYNGSASTIGTCVSPVRGCGTNLGSIIPRTIEFYATAGSFKSPSIFVTWTGDGTEPSASCGLGVSDTQAAESQFLVAADVAANELAVCARLNTPVNFAGGKVTITLPSGVVDPGSLPEPTVTDGSAAACDQESGIHPIFSQTVLGQDIVVDAALFLDELRICVQAGLTGKVVSIPISVPDPSVLPGFDFGIERDTA